MNKKPHLYILRGRTPYPTWDVVLWGRWLEAAERTVAQTEVTPDVTVSTVFLGLDHQFSPQGVPMLFETMVFGGTEDGLQERYATWEEAETGHNRIVEKLR